MDAFLIYTVSVAIFRFVLFTRPARTSHVNTQLPIYARGVPALDCRRTPPATDRSWRISSGIGIGIGIGIGEAAHPYPVRVSSPRQARHTTTRRASCVERRASSFPKPARVPDSAARSTYQTGIQSAPRRAWPAGNTDAMPASVARAWAWAWALCALGALALSCAAPPAAAFLCATQTKPPVRCAWQQPKVRRVLTCQTNIRTHARTHARRATRTRRAGRNATRTASLSTTATREFRPL